MEQRSYVIRRAFLLPLTIDVLLFFALLLISLFTGSTYAERLVLAVIFLPMLLIFLEVRSRTVITEERGIRFKKFLRTKEVAWKDITHVGALIVRNKVYLLLTTVKGYFIFSNAYKKFSFLIHDIVEHVGEDKVEEEVRNQMGHPTVSWGNIISAWFAAVVIVGIISMKLFQL